MGAEIFTFESPPPDAKAVSFHDGNRRFSPRIGVPIFPINVTPPGAKEV
jgi:hypothetical protein